MTIFQENVELLKKGCGNLRKHINNALHYGVPIIVAVNAMEYENFNLIELMLIRYVNIYYVILKN
jgi:methylenetetrahydrofolate dehydrogenase (NADP+)/methenyltetrahydrofolate cyclohydrolase/formyltetrahydrofolate synthetase